VRPRWKRLDPRPPTRIPDPVQAHSGDRSWGEVAAIQREWAKLIGVNGVRDLRNLLEQLHDALWAPSAEE
jgi:hypothetical protein